MEKKGELTSKQIITIVILIISFGVIILFWFFLNPGGEISKQACLNSITMRGGIPLDFFKDIVVVKCKTQKVCITSGEACEVTGKEVLAIKVENDEDVSEMISKLVEDCWTMTAKGESKYGEYKHCGMCNLVYFGKDVQDSFGVKSPSGRRQIKLQNKAADDVLVHYEESDDKYWLDEPIGIISFLQDKYVKDGKHSIVSVAQYDSDSIKDVGCEEWVF